MIDSLLIAIENGYAYIKKHPLIGMFVQPRIREENPVPATP